MAAYDMSDLFTEAPTPASGGKKAGIAMILQLLAQMLDEPEDQEDSIPESDKEEVRTRPHFFPSGG